jgi:predicted TIM-barrel fold metal-dependent hydrolase
MHSPPNLCALLKFVVAAHVISGCASQPARASHYAGPVLDSHVHLDPPERPDSAGTGRIADVATVSTELRKLPPGSRLGLVTIAPPGDMARTRRQNDAVLEAEKSRPGAFWAIPSVHPLDGDQALVEIDRVAAAGAKMLKLHPNAQHFDVAGPEVAKVVEHATTRGILILFDGYSPFDANETGKFLMLAVQQPKARIVLAHLGGPRFSEMMIFAAARKFVWYPKNVWFDLSVVAQMFARSPYRDQLAFVCRSIGLDRVLFASDYPVSTPAGALEDVRALGFTEAEEKQVMHDNMARLLGY